MKQQYDICSHIYLPGNQVEVDREHEEWFSLDRIVRLLLEKRGEKISFNAGL